MTTHDDIRSLRTDLAGWLDSKPPELVPAGDHVGGLAEEVARTRANQQVLWRRGWLRHGWPEAVGGWGGPALLRAAVCEEATSRGLFSETVIAMTEVLAPTVVARATELAARLAVPLLSGAEGWCQGFSEPEAGSDLAAIRCAAVDDGDAWVVDGQKVWTTFAQFASRIVLLVRTGSAESRHRRITALLVDLDAPGVTVRPLPSMDGEDEFSEIFFSGVRVPKDRVVGEVDGGWAVAMDILRSERGGIFWMESAWLLAELDRLVVDGECTNADDEMLGATFAEVVTLRARSWSTQHRLATGAIAIPETSVDKILMATAEQRLFDVARRVLAGRLELGDDPGAGTWRSKYLYSRAATIYGGTAEIQRNIVADQLLSLRVAR